MSHTPGPWNVGSTDNKKEVVIVSPHPSAPHGYQVARSCYAWDVETGEATAETIANARLIAAAPDLLAACRAVAGVFQDSNDPPLYAQKCIAAIAKATGET